MPDLGVSTLNMWEFDGGFQIIKSLCTHCVNSRQIVFSTHTLYF